MKKIILALLLITGLSGMAQNDAKAKELLDKVSNTISSYDNIYIKFDYKLVNKEAGVEQDNKGDLSISGEKYHVNFFGTTQIFDGKKTYTVIPENEEVNISDAEEEDGTLTPSKFYTFYKKGYTYRMGGEKTIHGKKIRFVKLTPIDSNSEIAGILIGVEPKTNHIYTIIENGKNGTQTILTVTKFVANQSLPADTFRFNRKKYEDQGYIIND